MTERRGGPAGTTPDGGAWHRPTTPRAAATVVLLRPGHVGPEVLLTHRPVSMVFAGGLFVFPGGAVDETDLAPEVVGRLDLDASEAFDRLGGSTSPDEALAAHVAAIRELFEDAGVLLGEPRPSPAVASAAQAALVSGRVSFAAVCVDLDVRLTGRALVPLSRWVTPAALPRRFDARFFATELPPGTQPTFVGAEVAAHRWLTPAAALDGLADGSVPMWMPTSANLQRLVHAPDMPAVARRLASGRGGLPERAPVAPDIVRVSLPSGAGVDGLEVAAYLVGGSSVVAVDPGDPSEEALLELVEAAAAEDSSIGAVALTSPDPDHAGGSEHVREGLGVPVFATHESARPLPFPVAPLHDGDRVPGADLRIVLLEAPGPRPEHVVYHVPSSRAVLTGDLLGSPPAFAIPPPPDLRAWRRSVERVRDLAPLRLLPAHGDPVEGETAVRAALDEARDRLA